MRIPYTIPKKILRFYTRKLDEEALQKSYEGRLLISENPNWDKNITPSLAQQCLEIVQDEFLFYDRLMEHFNSHKLKEYETQRSQWEKDLADYMQKKAIYDRKLASYEQKVAMFGENFLEDPNYDDDEIDEDPDGIVKVDAKGKPIEPDKVEGEYPEYEPVHQVLDLLKY